MESLKSHLAAAGKKWRFLSRRERMKLAVKLALRAAGIKLPLYLGGYYAEENRLQLERDRAISRKLKQERAQTGYFALVAERLDRGGLEEVVGTLARELNRRGISVQVFCLQGGGAMAERLRQEGLEVRIFCGDKERLRAYCRERRPRLANTHFVTEWLDVFYEEAIPVVEVVHNMYVFLNRREWLREQDKAACVSRYIAVSERAAEIFLKHMPDLLPGRVRVVENGVAAETPLYSREEMRKGLGISEEAFVYIAVGSIAPRKNQLGLLRAWHIASGLIGGPNVLVIAGAGADAAYEERVRAAAEEISGASRVILTGHSGQVRELLNMADAFVLASYYEGCSMAAMEALSVGLPLIHTDCGNGDRLTAGGKCGILTANPLSGIEDYDAARLYDAVNGGRSENIEQMARAMCRLWEERESWKADRERIAAYAAEYFSVERMVDRYLEEFERDE